MNSMENKSDNSLNKSVARSSSGVSTQQSADGIDSKDADCQIVYGNYFSRLLQPEVRDQNTNRSSISELDTYYDSCSINDGLNETVERSTLGKGTKNRRHSEASSRTIGKIKNSFSKRKNESDRKLKENEEGNNFNLDKLLTTLTNLQENKSPCYFNEADNSFFRNPKIPNPSTIIQSVVESATELPEIAWKSFEEILIYRAENTPKELFFGLIESSGKVASNNTITYSKLYRRAQRVCYHITSKLICNEQPLNLRPGQSVGLVFSPEDALDFIIAFFACTLAKVIAVPVEKPSLTQLTGTVTTGKYLTQLSVNVLLTNLTTYRDLTQKECDIRSTFPWSNMNWVPINNFYNEKVSKSFSIPESCSTFAAPLFVEYIYSEENVLRGVPVTPHAAITHCQALETTCRYKEGQSLLCTDDIRRQSGLWHALLLTLYTGMSCYYLSNSIIKKNSNIFLSSVSKMKVSNVVTNSRVLHRSLSMDDKHVTSLTLFNVRNLVVSDASVPWISETLDHFMAKYGPIGLADSALLTYVSKSETLSLCTQRGRHKDLTQRLCLESLSYDLIKVLPDDQINGAISLGLQSSGVLLPGMKAVVVKFNQPNQLCSVDEIGEIAVQGPFCNRVFWMTADETSEELLMARVQIDGNEMTFTRTGLVGFFKNISVIEKDHVYIVGSLPNFLEIIGRRLNSDDIIGTVTVVKPSGVLYKARCCVFSVPVLHHNQVVIAAEINHVKFSDDRIYDWLSRVLQSVLQLHQVNVYCIIGLPPNSFPKSLLGDIDQYETRNRFLSGTLSVTHMIICPQTAIPNISSLSRQPSNRNASPFSPMSFLAHAVNSSTFASISGSSPALPMSHNSSSGSVNSVSGGGDTERGTRLQSLPEILEWRASHTPTEHLISIFGPKLTVIESLTCEQLYKRAEKVAYFIKEKVKCSLVGSVIGIIVNSVIELISCIYGCYYVGAAPLVINIPNKDALDFQFTVREAAWACCHSKAPLCLVSTSILKMLKSKELQWTWPVPLADVSREATASGVTIGRSSHRQQQLRTAEPAQLDREWALARTMYTSGDSADGLGNMMAVGVWTHAAISALCDRVRDRNQLTPGTPVLLSCLPPHSTAPPSAVLLACLTSVYSGCHIISPSPSAQAASPQLWLDFLSVKKIKHAFFSEKILKQTLKDFKSENFEVQFSPKKPPPKLSHLETFVLCLNDRPNYKIIREFLSATEELNYDLQTFSIGMDCNMTPGYFLQIPPASYPRSVYLDRVPLRNNKIVESPEDQSLEVIEAGIPLPDSRVIVVDPTSHCQKATNQLGEFWLESNFSCSKLLAAASSSNLESIYRDMNCLDTSTLPELETSTLSISLTAEHLRIGESTEKSYSKTGLMGFLRTFGADQHLVVMGINNDVIITRGFIFFPSEIEDIILSVDPRLFSKCVVFAECDLLIAIVELAKDSYCRLDLCLRMLPSLVKSVIENCLVPIGVIQFVNPGQLGDLIGDSRRLVKLLWLRRKLEGPLQFYFL